MDKSKSTTDYLVRGILIGGSLGVFAALLGFVDMGRGLALGMVAGFAAGFTMAKKREKETDKNQ